MKTIIVATLVLFCALNAMAAPAYPHIMDDYEAVIEINHPLCPPNPDPRFHFACPNSESFFEARSYSHNALKIAHSHQDQFIYHFDRYSGYFVQMDQWNCSVFNVTEMALNHHGFLDEYDPTTNHLVTSDKQYLLTVLNFTYRGQSSARGIYTDDWTATGTRVLSRGTLVGTYVWQFSAANWTSGDPRNPEHVIPVRLTFTGTFTPNNGTSFAAQEIMDFVDYKYGNEVPDFRSLMIPWDAFCPELVQKPIPTLPSQFSHTFEMNDLVFNTTYSGRFLYDYDNNFVRMEHWMNDANYVTVLDVNAMTNLTFSWHQQCISQTITPEGHGFDRLINFTSNPPHLVRLTETVGHFSPNPQWLYAGLRPVRDVIAETWFVRNNITFHEHNRDGITSMIEIVAWFFTPPGWNIAGLPSESIVPIRSSRVGSFFNSSAGRNQFFSEHREFSDVKYPLEPGIFEIPPFCPGGRSMSSGSSGISSGGAAGLAFGMLIVGGLIGAGVLYYFTRRRSGMSVQGSEEVVSLHQSTGYGTTSNL